MGHRRLGHIYPQAIQALANDPRVCIKIKGPKVLPDSEEVEGQVALSEVRE